MCQFWSRRQGWRRGRTQRFSRLRPVFLLGALGQLLDLVGVVDDQVHELVEALRRRVSVLAASPQKCCQGGGVGTDPDLALDAHAELLVQPDADSCVLRSISQVRGDECTPVRAKSPCEAGSDVAPVPRRRSRARVPAADGPRGEHTLAQRITYGGGARPSPGSRRHDEGPSAAAGPALPSLTERADEPASARRSRAVETHGLQELEDHVAGRARSASAPKVSGRPCAASGRGGKGGARLYMGGSNTRRPPPPPRPVMLQCVAREQARDQLRGRGWAAGESAGRAIVEGARRPCWLGRGQRRRYG